MTVTGYAVEYDALRDKSYRDTALGPDVVAWLAWLELGGARERTLDQYERDLAVVCRLYPGRTVGQLTDAELGHVIRQWPPKSRRVRKAAIDSFFRWAMRTRRIEKNPADVLPRIKRPAKKVMDVFSDPECDALCGLPLQDAALMLVLLDGGLRKSEARGLTAGNCRLDTRELIVLDGKGGKDRVVPMTERMARAVAELSIVDGLGRRDFLWYTRPGGGKVSRAGMMGDGSFDRWWGRCVGLSGVRYRNPHMARHTFATRWLRGMVGREATLGPGKPGRLETLSGVMGHESIKTTFDLYGHLDLRDARADLAEMAPDPGPVFSLQTGDPKARSGLEPLYDL